MIKTILGKIKKIFLWLKNKNVPYIDIHNNLKRNIKPIVEELVNYTTQQGDFYGYITFSKQDESQCEFQFGDKRLIFRIGIFPNIATAFIKTYQVVGSEDTQTGYKEIELKDVIISFNISGDLIFNEKNIFNHLLPYQYYSTILRLVQ